MAIIWTIFTLVNIFLSDSVRCDQSELLSVAVLYRHGCRSPRMLCKNDPYAEKASEIWPEGFGQLTNVGKSEAFALGRWFRKEYNDFIPEKYDPKFIRILSSDKDRCLMSAACNLAGLFPPQEEQVWNPNIHWQPVPIHSTPTTEDLLISTDEMDCEKYRRLYAELMESKNVLAYLESNKNLFQYLTNHTGDDIRTPADVMFTHDSLFIESYYNLSLPDWSRGVFPEKTLPLITMKYALDTNTTDLGRLKSGPLIDYIASFFEDVLKSNSSHKFLMLSGHDSTIARLMNTLGIYDLSWPEYASTIAFELRRKPNGEFIRIYFRDSKKLEELKLPRCSSDCSFGEFVKMIGPIRINKEEWKKECDSV